MAIITSRYALGWYGISYASNDTLCSEFNLTKNIGSYKMTNSGGGNWTKTFVRGTSLPASATEEVVNGLLIFGYSSTGAPWVWSLQKEESAFYDPESPFVSSDQAGQPFRGGIAFTKNDEGDAILACGRMYFIINNRSLEFDIPGFVPSADGVDMGRIDTTNKSVK